MSASAAAAVTPPAFDSSFNGSDITPTPANPFSPGRIAVDETTSDVYVIDTANNVIDKFSAAGAFISTIDGSGSTTGSFSFGGGSDPAISVDNHAGTGQGNVYVASDLQGVVFAFDNTGAFLWEVSSPPLGEPIWETCGVAVDSGHNVWVTNYTLSHFLEFNSAGTFTGTTHNAQGNSCHSSIDSADNLYSALWNGATKKYDSAGTFLSTLDPNAATDVATDNSNDSVYVDETSQIAFYAANGASITPFGSGAGVNSTGVVVNSSTGKLYVSDGGNGVVDIYDRIAVPATDTLTVTPAGAGSGTVTSDVFGIDCGTSCSRAYLDGDTVTLTAAPAASSVFTGWSGGGCSGTGTCVVTLSADTNVTATFDAIPPHNVTVSKTGAGSGTVTSVSTPTPAQEVDCGSTCGPLPFDDGSDIVLTATPAAHSTFTGWSGGGCSGTGTCELNPLSADTTVTANFDAIPQRALTVSKNGTGSGTVTGTPGINCGVTCQHTYDDGAVVTPVTATPAAHSTFTGWTVTGDPSTTCTGTTSPCTVTMNADVSLTATYDHDPPTVVTGAASGVTQTAATAAGTVNPNGAATTCTIQYGTTLLYGSVAPCSSAPGSGTSAVGASAGLTGLTPSTTYHFRLVATNAGGTTNGLDAAFTTAAAPTPTPAPTVATGAASGVSASGASLAGTVNPNGVATTCQFQYGTTTSYGSAAPCASAPGSGSSAVAASAALSGLTAGTTYHYRLVATSAGGTTNGADATFTTSAAAGAGKLTAASSLKFKKGKAKLKLTCTGAAGAVCKGTVKLTVKIKKGKKSKTVTIAKIAVNLTKGKSKRVTVKLPSSVAKALKKSHKLKATAKGPGISKTITLKG